MDINKTNLGASTYAMKKAMDMPKLMLSLVQQAPENRPLNAQRPAAAAVSDVAAITGKGNLIDIVA